VAQQTVMIHFRLSGSEAESLRQLAQQAGQSLSHYLRERIKNRPTASSCAHCEKVRRDFERWLSLASGVSDKATFGWSAAEFRQTFQELMPPKIDSGPRPVVSANLPAMV
jgi:mobilization protein NikA